MRSLPRWLIITAAIFAIYLIALGVFVSRQMSVQSRHIVWTKQLGRLSFGKLRLLSDGRLLVQDYSGLQTVFSPQGDKLYELQSPAYGSGSWEGLYRELPGGEAYIVTEGPLNQTNAGRGLANVVITSSGTPEIVHIDAEGRELARIRPGFVFDSNTGLLPVDGQIVLSDASRHIQAVDEAGSTLWQCTSTAGQLTIAGPDGGLLSMDVNSITGRAELALIDAGGTQLWLRELPGDFGGSLLCSGQRILYVDNSGDIRCLDGDGNELWRHDGDSDFAHDGAAAMANSPWMPESEVLQLLDDGRLAAVDLQNRLVILDSQGRPQHSVSLPEAHDLQVAVDSRRGRIVTVCERGLEVFDLQGRRLSSNSFVRGSGRPQLDSERGQGYVLENGRLNCFSY